MTTCCESMATSLVDDRVPIRYFAQTRTFGLDYLDGGSSFLVLVFCPFSGSALPARLSDDWFDQLRALGLDPGAEGVPARLDSDSWWRGTELDDWVPGEGSALATGRRREVAPVRRDVSDDVLPHACERMVYAVGEADLPITYTARAGAYALELQETGERGLVIEFCPFCGAHLPS